LDAGLGQSVLPVRTAMPAAGGNNAARPEAAANAPAGNTIQSGATSATGEPLSKEQQAQVRELKKRDAEVKAHEQAHAAVGGAYASAPKYTYTRGPDGKKYAVGGEVEIDTSPERTPEATIRKMDVVIRAALAPAEPSSQDRAVARQAQQQRLEAQRELTQQETDQTAPGSAGEDQTAKSSMETGLLAQILSQSQPSERTKGDAASGARAYQSAAGLATQLFRVAS
jgi:hypothetical protein